METQKTIIRGDVKFYPSTFPFRDEMSDHEVCSEEELDDPYEFDETKEIGYDDEWSEVEELDDDNVVNDNIEHEDDNMEAEDDNMDDNDPDPANVEESCFQTVPNTPTQAIESKEGEEWSKAIESEILAHQKNGTFQVVSTPHGERTIGSRFVFVKKFNDKGELVKYKARSPFF